MQAVNSADFAMGRFYFLKRLLLLHGRNNYRRTAKMVVLILYKNVFMIIAQVCFSAFNGFSGQKFYFQLGVRDFSYFWAKVTRIPRFEVWLFVRHLLSFLDFGDIYHYFLLSRPLVSSSSQLLYICAISLPS
jgi:hypothetical protein